MSYSRTIHPLLANLLKEHPVIYVTRDVERALGLLAGTSPSSLLPHNFYIIGNDAPYARLFQKNNPEQITLVSGKNSKTLDTIELLTQPETKEILEKIATATGQKPALVVFKNTTRIEHYAKKEGWTLLNPPSELAEKIENKITQADMLPSARQFLIPDTKVVPLKDVVFSSSPLIAQFGHGHTGESTQLITTAEHLSSLQKQFPERLTRISPFIKGVMFTSNICIAPVVLSGNISYQITGLSPFTDLPFSTVGNDWGYAHTIFHSNTEQSRLLKKKYNTIVEAVATDLHGHGWKGLFGVDIILDPEKNDLHLIEINARQPASTTYESWLQIGSSIETPTAVNAMTIFEAHLLALLTAKNPEKYPTDLAIIPITAGAQIIQRWTGKPLSGRETLENAGFQVLEYTAEKHNSDFLRIQTKKSFILGDGKFTSQGQVVANICETNLDTKNPHTTPLQTIINKYLSLPDLTIPAPYYNNRRQNIKASLRALAGKGTPEEIVEEAHIFATREKIKLSKLSLVDRTRFLVNHFLGIDCSGFVYHVLNEHRKKTVGKSELGRSLAFSNKSLLRRMAVYLRPAQNVSVAVFADEKNSREIPLHDVRIGDIVVMIHKKEERSFDHIILITNITQQNSITTLTYTHSIAWPSDGEYNHGVRTGIITITDPNKHIKDQNWCEKGVYGTENYTHQRAIKADTCSLRRLLPFS